MAYTTINKSSDYFNTVTYTGDGNATQAITNTFQTDFSWIKHRGTTAAHTLQELLTIKSDDMQGRNETLNAIVKGLPIPRPGIPESFKVLMRELQALCLDVATYKLDVYQNKGLKDYEINLMGDTQVNFEKQFN